MQTTDEGELEAQIVLNIYTDSFSVWHTNNIDLKKVYEMYKAALEYLDEMMDSSKVTHLH